MFYLSLIFSVVCLASTWDSIVSQEPISATSDKKFMHRCSLDVQSEFEVPESLQYKSYSSDEQDYPTELGLPKFSLLYNVPKCGETFSVTVPLEISIPTLPYINAEQNITSLSFTVDGSAVHMKDSELEHNEIFYHRDNFCIASIDEEQVILKLCKSACSLNTEEFGDSVCLPLCCPLGTVSVGYDTTDKTCSKISRNGSQPDTYDTERLKTDIHSQLYLRVKKVGSEPNCTSTFSVQRSVLHSGIRLLHHGRILGKVDPTGVKYADEDTKIRSREGLFPFCVDGIANLTRSEQWETNATVDVTATTCDENPGVLRPMNFTLLVSLLADSDFMPSLVVAYFSCPLYFITFVVYVSTWDKQNIRGWIVIVFSFLQVLSCSTYVLIFSVISLGFVQRFLADTGAICVLFVVSFVSEAFFSVSVYSWTAIMTFDFWTKLSTMVQSAGLAEQRKRFLFYVLFAAGVPMSVASVCLSDSLGFYNETSGVLGMEAPKYYKLCFTFEDAVYRTYSIVCKCVLFAINLLFACLVFRTLWAAHKNSKQLTKSSGDPTVGERLIFTVKLLFAVGGTLILSILSSFGLLPKGRAATILLNEFLIQSIGLFWLLVCSSNTRKQIREKYPNFYERMRKQAKDAEKAVCGFFSSVPGCNNCFCLRKRRVVSRQSTITMCETEMTGVSVPLTK